jgi:hypothetical protein
MRKRSLLVVWSVALAFGCDKAGTSGELFRDGGVSDSAGIEVGTADLRAADAPAIDAPTIDAPAIDAPTIDARTDAAAIDAPIAPDGGNNAGRWAIHFQGSGRIEDIATGNPIDLPINRRIHVAMFPEGYTQADLAAGTFDMDIERWMTEVFRIEPYSTFKEAFVVWKIKLPSNARGVAGDPQTADTAFKLPMTVDGSGVGRVTTPTATAVWNALADLPVAADFTGGRGLRNVVGYMHVFDSRTGRAGFSGLTTTLGNPGSATQRVSLAIALGRAHEFTHAVGYIRDEYIETTSGNPTANDRTNSSAGITNVVASPTCSTIPWRHLLKGTAINPDTDQLIGAFGNATQGYHPEFKCLMNGTHDNAQFYGGNGNLRTETRLCNFCRELLALRVFERTSVLPDTTTSLDSWITTYRSPFFTRYGFKVPSPVPQQSSDGMAWWQPCVP